MRDELIRLSQVGVLLLSVLFIGYTLYQGWDTILRYASRLDAALFTLGMAVIPVQMLLKRFAWTRVMEHLGEDIGFYKAMSLISMFQVGSYIPGGIWHFIGISYWGEREGLEKKKTFYGAAVNALINLAVGLTVFVVFGLTFFEKLGVLHYLVGSAAVIGLAVFLNAGIYFRTINFVLSVFDRDRMEQRMGTAALVETAGIHLVARVIEGAAVFLLVSAVHPLGIELLFPVIAMAAGAWALGFLVFFMPSGAGVKEVSLIYLLGLVIPSSVAALIAVALRVVYVFWESVIAVGFVYLDRGNLRFK
ncbi:MAG: lysylphosphatidylglycerol synthase domain-containing protein [Candidatus Nanohaloarchaea archaeon]